MSSQSELTTAQHATRLRTGMVDRLVAVGTARSAAVERALRTVPRHLFAPEADLDRAYDENAIIGVKHDERAATLSSVSAAWLQATMLEQADVRPGQHVLEIGSGGYNAALLAELTGSAGSVTTVDIDPDITDRASRLLDESGHSRITVTCQDAEHDLGAGQPFDRIVVTAGAWDIPPAWRAQLTGTGRLVLPLRIGGLTRSIALTPDGDGWTGGEHHMCGFVPIRGRGHHSGQQIDLGPTARLHLDDGPAPPDPEALRRALAHPAQHRGTGVAVRACEPFDGLHLWLATRLPFLARLTADSPAVDANLFGRLARSGTRAHLGTDSLAYLADAVPTDNDDHEFQIRSHGPRADELAEELREHIRTWSAHHRQQQPRITAHPRAARPPAGSDRIITKQHTGIALRWN